MKRQAAALLAAACILAGCTAAPGAGPRTAGTRPPGTGPSFAVGTDLYVSGPLTPASADSLAARDLGWIRDDLHVRDVQVDWNLYSTGSSVYAGAATPSPAVIATVTAMARDRFGMTVTFRVLFTVPAPPGRTGRILPADQGAWFASLYAAEEPYLAAAQRDGVTEFIAGTERTAIETAAGWGKFYRQAARVYSGPLSYATWGGRPGYAGVTDGNLAQLPPVRDYGITAYPDAALTAGASQTQVTAAWTAYLQHVPRAVLRRTALDEVGIPAAAGAYRDPWDFNAYGGAADDAVQARWFTAACTAARKLRMRGVWFFPVFLGDNPYDPYPGLAKFEDRPAAVAAIAACAEGRD